jgi:hypothetical protein
MRKYSVISLIFLISVMIISSSVQANFWNQVSGLFIKNVNAQLTCDGLVPGWHCDNNYCRARHCNGETGQWDQWGDFCDPVCKIQPCWGSQCSGIGESCSSGQECNYLNCEYPNTAYCTCAPGSHCECRHWNDQPDCGASLPGCGNNPVCTPPACPAGLIDCGTSITCNGPCPGCERYNSCEAYCNNCNNKAVVYRYCRYTTTSLPTTTVTSTTRPSLTTTSTYLTTTITQSTTTTTIIEICNSRDDNFDCNNDDRNNNGKPCDCIQLSNHSVYCDSGVDEGWTYTFENQVKPTLDKAEFYTLLTSKNEVSFQDVTNELRRCDERLSVDIPSDGKFYFIDIDWNNIWSGVKRQCNSQEAGDSIYCHVYDIGFYVTLQLKDRDIVVQVWKTTPNLQGNWQDVANCLYTTENRYYCDLSEYLLSGDIPDLKVKDIKMRLVLKPNG